MITDKQKKKKERWRKKDNPALRSILNCPHCNSRKFTFLAVKTDKGKTEVLADKNGNARANCTKCEKEFAVRLNREEKKLEVAISSQWIA